MPRGFGIAKLRLFGQSAKIVCSGFTEVCNHFILFWRLREKLVILHPNSGGTLRWYSQEKKVETFLNMYIWLKVNE